MRESRGHGGLVRTDAMKTQPHPPPSHPHAPPIHTGAVVVWPVVGWGVPLPVQPEAALQKVTRGGDGGDGVPRDAWEHVCVEVWQGWGPHEGSRVVVGINRADSPGSRGGGASTTLPSASLPVGRQHVVHTVEQVYGDAHHVDVLLSVGSQGGGQRWQTSEGDPQSREAVPKAKPRPTTYLDGPSVVDAVAQQRDNVAANRGHGHGDVTTLGS